MLEMFNMFADYNRWANALVYEEAGKLDAEAFKRDTGAFFGSLQATLNHVLVADLIWLGRLTGTGAAPDRLDAVLHEEFEDLRAARMAKDFEIVDWVGKLSEEQLEGVFTYWTVTEPKTEITQRLWPTLSHFFNHQTHHRGQAHAILTTLGRPSLALDLIYFHRSEEGKKWR